MLKEFLTNTLKHKAMNWKNVDLKSQYERSQNLLDNYDFDTLLLEISCNIPENKINEITVMEQALKSLNEKIKTAIEILNDNIKNITAKAIEESGN